MQENCLYTEKCNKIDCDKDFCVKKYKLDALYNEAGLSLTQRRHISLRIDEDGTDLEEFKQLATINNNIVDFVKEGNNLYLYSANCGNGKTSWSLRFIQSYLGKIWPQTELVCRALFVSVPRLLLALKDEISTKNEYATFMKERIMEADIVVWDDIANKVGTDYEINRLLSFIDGRVAEGKTNIYTSNLSPASMTDSLGARLASRICNYSTNICLRGGDKRGISK